MYLRDLKTIIASYKPGQINIICLSDIDVLMIYCFFKVYFFFSYVVEQESSVPGYSLLQLKPSHTHGSVRSSEHCNAIKPKICYWTSC